MRPDRTSVLVCRGCCCGTTQKHPEVDHSAHLDTLRSALPDRRSTKLWTVDCLGPCDHSNVIVVRSGSTRRWFGNMLADQDIEALAGWVADGAVGHPPAQLQTHEFIVSSEPAVISARLLPLTSGQLIDTTYQAVRAGLGAWTMGVHGATAEFDAGDPTRAVSRSEHEIEVTTSTAAIRFRIDGDTRAFMVEPVQSGVAPGLLVLATIDRRPSPRHVITEIGPDDGAIRSADRHGVLFDLGLGREAASFCVRAVGDTVDVMRAERGNSWRDVFERLLPLLVERSPDRVVIAGGSRAEITAPIPTAGGAAPAGSRSHLLPGELELGRDLPPGLTLPTGFQPAAIFYPPRDWRLPAF